MWAEHGRWPKEESVSVLAVQPVFPWRDDYLAEFTSKMEKTLPFSRDFHSQLILEPLVISAQCTAIPSPDSPSLPPPPTRHLAVPPSSRPAPQSSTRCPVDDPFDLEIRRDLVIGPRQEHVTGLVVCFREGWSSGLVPQLLSLPLSQRQCGAGTVAEWRRGSGG